MNRSSAFIRLGILGAGGFANFSVKPFLEVPDLKISGVYDSNPKNSKVFSDKFDCRVFNSERLLLEDSETDLIYIATPPFLHYSQSKQALLAGKHVICEKPAALISAEVSELISIANKKNLLYVVNLMQRYNPLFQKVKSILDEKILGEFLHGYFENYASDENLDEKHWMWDESKSGGIFIEHAVHFFDLFEGWLGKGEVTSSQKIMKATAQHNIWPEVQAICNYNNRLVNFYHGFHQADRMDRQEMKLVFETGDITLYEWIPSRLILNGLVSESQKKRLQQIFNSGSIKKILEFPEQEKHFRNHFSSRYADFKIRLETGDDKLKYNIYQQLLTDMISDQVSWIKNRGHQRVITGENGLSSLVMAENSNKMAVKL
jgi:predicted dehydrogenase